jgi:nucleoside-diphosphate-sugar epimerase
VKVFVTGHQGYIGAHLVDLLKAAGHSVTGCDLGLFAGTEWRPPTAPDRALVKDTRDVTVAELDGHDCVMQLAAISNDPMGDLDPELTFSVNRDASVRLAELAKAAGVPRYLLSSSCSIYGAGDKLDLAEDDPLKPVTAYAASKIESEHAIAKLAADDFSPAYLRNATAYGYSPALRVDLVVNNLLASALSYGEIRVMSDGSPWRPLIHCRDIAAAFVAFMQAPRERIHNQAVNVGGNSENYQVRDVGAQVARLVPGAEVVYTGEAGEDPRNYRVCFDRLEALLPDFALDYTLESGMEELHREMVDSGFGAREFESDRFVRLRWLQHELGRLRGARGARRVGG